MSKRIDHTKLRTINDVHRAQKYVSRKIYEYEDRLIEDYDDIAEVLSIDYWIDTLLGKMPGLIPVIQSAYAVYTFVTSLFSKKSC